MTDKQTTDVGDVSESRRNVPIKQESKRHHHVPQLYLKRWCDKHNKLYEFRRFIKNTEVKSHPKSTKHTGFAWNCYDLDGLSSVFPTLGKTHLEDSFFKSIDQSADRSLILLNNLEIPSSNEDRSSFAVFLISLVVRNPWFFKSMRSEFNGSDFKKLASESSVANRTLEFSQLLAKENGLDSACALFFEEIIVNKNIVDNIINCHWELACDENAGLLTSDAPVWWSGFGDNDSDFFAMLSISPSLSLIIGNSARTVDIVKNSRSLFKQYNDNICKQAFEMVYSNDQKQNRFIENRLGIFGDYFGLSNYKFMEFFDAHRCGEYPSPIDERLVNMRSYLHEVSDADSVK